MSTAEMMGRINLDLYPEWELGKTGSIKRQDSRSGAGVKKRRRSVSLLSVAVGAVTGKLERADTLADKAVGYGLCGFTFFYLGAHVIKSVF